MGFRSVRENLQFIENSIVFLSKLKKIFSKILKNNSNYYFNYYYLTQIIIYFYVLPR